jgi:NDP-sugar pyrophosphorylase family protein
MSPTADLYIVAAGNGSRLSTSIPKPLVPITQNEPCLTSTLQQIGEKFRRVFVVTNVRARDQWHRYYHSLQTYHPELARLVVDLQISSGLGDGHATLHGLLAAERRGDPNLAQDVAIAWGDVFWPHAELIDELYAVPLSSSGLLPAVRESDPYVALLVDDRMQCLSADFSKHGERHSSGLHDQSVFRFSRSALKASLQALHDAFWKGGRYITPGGELSLLYSFHHLYNVGKPVSVYQTDYPTLSFNTVEEVRAIQCQIRGRWQGRARAEQSAGKQHLSVDV